MLDKKTKIGNITLPNAFILAPMAGYTDAAFRKICAEAGAGLTVTEMVSAMGLLRGGKDTRKLLKTTESEKIKCIQLFGHEPEVFAGAVRLAEVKEFDIIDINMGCPVKKVVKKGEGSALMKSPALAADIVKAVKDGVDKPVTVKMRLGVTDKTLAEELIGRVEEAGADAVTVHGRTTKQMFGGECDYAELLRLKGLTKKVFIGNGDIRSAAQAEKALGDFDAVSIGRGAVGNPFIFSTLTGTPFDLSISETMIYHLRLLESFYGNSYSLCGFRKFTSQYLAGKADMKEIKLAIYACREVSEMIKIIEDNAKRIDE